MKNRILIFLLLAAGFVFIITNSCKKDDNSALNEVIDIDGNVYHTVIIGTQTWMVENLKTTKYNDGAAIPLVKDSLSWSGTLSAGYCWYNNDSITYGPTYGALYNWYTVNTGKLSPKGWHVPSNAEWTLLIEYLGGATVAGPKLTEAGSSHWHNTIFTSINETGFTMLPGGFRMNIGEFGQNGHFADYWSSTESDYTYYAWFLHMQDNYNDVSRLNTSKQYGFSVRCLKDE